MERYTNNQRKLIFSLIQDFALDYYKNKDSYHIKKSEELLKKEYMGFSGYLIDNKKPFNNYRNKLKDSIKKAVKQGVTGYDKILDVIEDVTFKEVQILNVALRGTFSLKMDIFEKAEATKFISFLLGYFFDNGIEIKKEVMLMLEVEDRKRVMFMMLKHKRCVVCGASSELHHSPALGIGYEFDDGKQTGFLPLCRKHHAEAHSVGLDTFNNKYKLKPLWLNDNQIKELIRVYKNHFKAYKGEK